MTTRWGSILDKLEALNLSGNTLVIFTSDNGPALFAEKLASAGPLRGRKRDLYEGGIRVPMLAWWPGHIKPGTRATKPAATYDLFATFCDAASCEIPESTDGQSLIPTLTGESEQEPEFLYWEIWEGDKNPKQAVLSGEWKLIRFHFNDPGKQAMELYNLSGDPGEKTNLAGANPDVVKQLLEVMEKEHETYPHAAIADR